MWIRVNSGKGGGSVCLRACVRACVCVVVFPITVTLTTVGLKGTSFF